MIFLFSGTGNTYLATKHLASAIGEDIIRLTSAPTASQVELTGSSICFAFPVYAWGVPPIVLDFIKRMPEAMVAEINRRRLPVWGLMTYGDEAGDALRMLRGALRRRGLELAGCWGATAPNTYVLLPGFDVDPADLQQRKLEAMKPRMEEIARKVKEGRFETDLHRGPWPRLKTALVYPLFKAAGIRPRQWSANAACTGCGTCARLCPVGNIRITEARRPEWGDACTSCCACFHGCPARAIDYGRMTRGKGQKPVYRH